jgi:pyrroline-5-carboxylate reductase
MTAACKGPGASDADLSFVMKLFGRLGHCIKLDESLMDAMTAVASSGSAYVFYLAEAMIRGALAVGFDAKAADQIVRQTIAGAAAMLSADSTGPVQMRAAVTSRGGTTAAATQVLDDARVVEAFSRAIIAARDRGRELAK